MIKKRRISLFLPLSLRKGLLEGEGDDELEWSRV